VPFLKIKRMSLGCDGSCFNFAATSLVEPFTKKPKEKLGLKFMMPSLVWNKRTLK
jgi:hypothetical protein